MEPSDLMVPIGLPEEEATLTCDAKGFPAPQYRYSVAFPFTLHHTGTFYALYVLCYEALYILST